MSGLFATWIQRTSQVSRSAISSPGSASGHTPCASQAGLTTGPCGPEAAHASPSAPQVSEAASTTSATSGPSSSVSSASAALQSFLVSRLQARTAWSGSTLYRLTWKERATPAQRQISALRASARRTSDSDFGGSGWPTTGAMDGNRAGVEQSYDHWIQSAERHKLRGVSKHFHLNAAADAAGWPTPNASVIEAKSKPPIIGNRKPTDPQISTADVAVHLAGWPTPNTTNNGKGEDPEAKIRRGMNPGLNPADAAMLAGWRTPTCQSPNSLRGNGQDPEKRVAQGHTVNLTDEVNWLKNNPQPARLTATGEMLTGSSAGMESGGQLNPAHSRWLMGLPPEWDACAPTVTPSSRKLRKPSSKP